MYQHALVWVSVWVWWHPSASIAAEGLPCCYCPLLLSHPQAERGCPHWYCTDPQVRAIAEETVGGGGRPSSTVTVKCKHTGSSYDACQSIETCCCGSGGPVLWRLSRVGRSRPPRHHRDTHVKYIKWQVWMKGQRLNKYAAVPVAPSIIEGALLRGEKPTLAHRRLRRCCIPPSNSSLSCSYTSLASLLPPPCPICLSWTGASPIPHQFWCQQVNQCSGSSPPSPTGLSQRDDQSCFPSLHH